MRGFVSKIVLSFISFMVFGGVVCAAQEAAYAQLEAYGLNTVAGYDTYLRTSKTSPGVSVVFDVTNPAGEKSSVTAVTNVNGVAQAEFSDYYTGKAGDYSVSVKPENGSSNGRVNTFRVYPGAPSENASKVSPADQVVRSSGDSAFIAVTLVDDFENAVSDHLIKLISSSDETSMELTSDSEYTDADGKVVFKVSSKTAGSVTYSAYDATADKVLTSRAKVAYFNSGEAVFTNAVPEKYAYAAFGNGSFSVDHFAFEDIPSSISVGDSVTFTITAYDVSDQPVVNYTGTVRFALLSENSAYVQLPEDYTFTTSDVGTHTFSLAMTFLQSGDYDVAVVDLEDSSVFGEYNFTIAEGGGSPVATGGITITNPVPGTYSNNVQVISGSAMPGTQLKIFDNDIEIASVLTNASGAFSYTTSAMPDGMHNIYVAAVNEVGTIISTSNTISVNIDTSAPTLTNVVFEPSDKVDPAANVTVKLYTEDDLASATVLFAENLYDLAKNPAGYYETSFTAPIEFGQYPLTFIVVDQLGNESRFENYTSLTVGVVPGQGGGVADVTGLNAVSADHRVTLNWTAPTFSTNPVVNFRVYYGLSPNQLTEAVDTFTASTTWYVPNLKNGVQYYFAVVAVDGQGNISPHFSNIVPAIPGPAVAEVSSPDVQLGTAGEEVISGMTTDVSETGPEVMWILLIAALGGMFYSQTSKRSSAIRENSGREHDLFK
ncbi:MAG: fibronectin type III domain-containing protein [Candidatus Peregrinibacteria bacterium]